MIVPNDAEGYTLFETDTSDMTKKHTRYLFQHHIKNYYHLYDRLMMYSPDLKELDSMIKKISPSWQKRLRGRVLTHFLKAFQVFSATPQSFGYFGDYIMACNYGKLRAYFKKLIKMMIKVYGIPNRYYHFNIERKDLYYISNIFASQMLPLTNKLVPKHLKLLKEV